MADYLFFSTQNEEQPPHRLADGSGHNHPPVASPPDSRHDHSSRYSNRLAEMTAGSDAASNIETLEALLHAESALLKASSSAVHNDAQHKRRKSEILNGMVDLYEQWWTLVDEGGEENKPKDIHVFEAMLEACSNHHPRGSLAMTVLGNYEDLFGADLALKPERRHYEQMLMAHAWEDNPVNPADVAMEAIRAMDQFGFTMKPSLSTYLLAIQCVSRDIVLSKDRRVVPRDTAAVVEKQTVQRAADLQNLLQKIYPLIREKDRSGWLFQFSSSAGEHPNHHEQVLEFETLKHGLAALRTISSSTEAMSSAGSVSLFRSNAEQAIDCWLALIGRNSTDNKDGLAVLCQRQGIDFAANVEQAARSVLGLYNEIKDRLELQSASKSLIEQVEQATGRKFEPLQPLLFASQSSGEGETTEMREGAKRLQEVPVGEMDPDSWRDAKRVFQWSICQDSEESVDIAMDLLGRCVKETATNTIARKTFAGFCTRNSMTSLTASWYRVWKQKGRGFAWSPERFVRSVDHFAALDPNVVGLKLNGKAISYIIQAALLQGVGNSTSGGALEMVDNLLMLFLDRRYTVQDASAAEILINRVLNEWAKSRRSDALARAELVFAKAQKARVSRKHLTTVTFSTMINLYAKAGKPVEAERLLASMAHEHGLEAKSSGGNSTRLKPNHISLNSALSAWANSGYEQAPESATALLHLYTKADAHCHIPPETKFYNTVLNTWVKSGRAESGAEALKLLSEMQELGLDPDSYTYNLVIHALSKSGDIDAAENILMEQCEQYASKQDANIQPNLGQFSNIMEAWSKSKQPEKVSRLRTLFAAICGLHQRGVLAEGPNNRACNLMLSGVLASDAPDRAAQGEAVLNGMIQQWSVQPDGRTYAMVVREYLETPNGLEKADQLLSEAMDKKVRMGIQAPAKLVLALAKADEPAKADAWLHRILDEWEQPGGMFRKQSISPSLAGAVVAAWFRAAKRDKNADAGPKAEKLIARLLELQGGRGNQSTANNNTMSDVVVGGLDKEALRMLPLIWAEYPASADRAYHTLQWLRQLGVADRRGFEAVRSAYARLNQPDKAEMVHREMLQDLQPRRLRRPAS